jgi:hypothetical protein
MPFAVTPVDCNVGPGQALATFVHYPPGSTAADVTKLADSGSLQLTQFDTTGKLSAKGTFELTFGSDKLSGTLDTFSCD